jgi:hypothetical protein
MGFPATGSRIHEGSTTHVAYEKGQRKYDNGDYYEGEMSNGKEFGRGKKTFANKESYDG